MSPVWCLFLGHGKYSISINFLLIFILSSLNNNLQISSHFDRDLWATLCILLTWWLSTSTIWVIFRDFVHNTPLFRVCPPFHISISFSIISSRWLIFPILSCSTLYLHSNFHIHFFTPYLYPLHYYPFSCHIHTTLLNLLHTRAHYFTSSPFFNLNLHYLYSSLSLQ